MTTFADQVYQYGGMPVGVGGLPFPPTGKAFFVDPAVGSDGNSGKKPTEALDTLYKAHSLCTAGKNDVVYLMGDGSTTATARLSLANAVSIDSTATTGVLTWSKAATHLIGITAPTSIASRARIAPPTGTYTRTTFNSGNFVVVSAQGCHFANFSVFHGFSTGGASMIAWTDSGGRNCYQNVSIQGGGDTASNTTNVATMRSLLVTGSVGENTFRGCSIGTDTVPAGRSTGSQEIELAGGTPRNRFESCVISTYAGAAGCVWVLIAGSGIDRYVLFRDCMFTNPVLPATAANATAMTVGMTVNAAAGGTVHVMNSMFYGASSMSTSALVFSNLPAANAKGGLGVVAT